MLRKVLATVLVFWVLYAVQASGNYTPVGSYPTVSACEMAGQSLHAPYFCKSQ